MSHIVVCLYALVCVGLSGVLGANVPLSLGLRTVIIGSSDESVVLPKNIVSGYGAPFDVYVGETPDFDVDKWYSIIIADKDVDFDGAREYAARTHARIVFLESVADRNDQDILGVEEEDMSELYGSSTPNITISNYGHSLAGIVNVNGSWDISETNPTGVKITDSDRVTPFIIYEENDDIVAAFTSNTSVGTEEMHFRFKAHMARLEENFKPKYFIPTEYTQAILGLGHAWFEWVTRGIFLGVRRLAISIQIDDWYRDCQVLDTGEKNWRISYDDVKTAVQWQKNLVSNVLTNGSDFKFEAAINGAGVAMWGLPDTGINQATIDYAHEFNWLTHAWTHMNMDWLSKEQCNGKAETCHPTAEQYDAEFGYNMKLVRGEAIASEDYIELYTYRNATPAGQFFNNSQELIQNNWSPKSMVTPEISGLYPANYDSEHDGRKPYPNNTLFMERLVANGMYNVVGDNSRIELLSENIYHGIISSTAQYGVEGVLIIPRWTPNMGWNCNSFDCLVYKYQQGACSWVLYGPSCPGADTMSGLDVTIREAKTATIPLLQLRLDSFMFHQANLRAQPYNGGQAPIAGIFTQEALIDTMRYINGLPFVSVPQDELAELYRERMARDECGLEGEIELDGLGIVTNVTVTSSGACVSVITITGSSGLRFNDETIKTYGSDTNSYKEVDGTSVSFNVSGSFL
eukprot:CFRG4110T1